MHTATDATKGNTSATPIAKPLFVHAPPMQPPNSHAVAYSCAASPTVVLSISFPLNLQLVLSANSAPKHDRTVHLPITWAPTMATCPHRAREASWQHALHTHHAPRLPVPFHSQRRFTGSAASLAVSFPWCHFTGQRNVWPQHTIHSNSPSSLLTPKPRHRHERHVRPRRVPRQPHPGGSTVSGWLRGSQSRKD